MLQQTDQYGSELLQSVDFPFKVGHWSSAAAICSIHSFLIPAVPLSSHWFRETFVLSQYVTDTRSKSAGNGHQPLVAMQISTMLLPTIGEKKTRYKWLLEIRWGYADTGFPLLLPIFDGLGQHVMQLLAAWTGPTSLRFGFQGYWERF